MAIKMLSGILAQRYEEQNDEGHVISPVGPMPIPASKRSPNAVELRLPPIVAVIVLWGGQKGQGYNVNLSIAGPGNEVIALPVQHKNWRSKPSHRIIIELRGVPVHFTESGIWRISVLIIGEPAGELLLPIYWDDEPPPAD